MKTHSLQYKFLTTIISAMMAIAVFIGGLSIYEIDDFVWIQAENFINVACEKEATQINAIFDDIEKSVNIMGGYILDLFGNMTEIEDPDKQNEVIAYAEDMFFDVAKYTSGAVAYYTRFAPEISDHLTGFFIVRAAIVRNISAWRRQTYLCMIGMIPSMWAGTGRFMKPENLSG